MLIDFGAFDIQNIMHESIPIVNQNAVQQQEVLSSHISNQLQKKCHSLSVKLVLFQFECHDNHGSLVIECPICLHTDCVKSFITSVPQIMEIWQIFISLF